MSEFISRKMVLALLASVAAGVAFLSWKRAPETGVVLSGSPETTLLERRLPVTTAPKIVTHVLRPREESGLQMPVVATAGPQEERGIDFAPSHQRLLHPAGALLESRGAEGEPSLAIGEGPALDAEVEADPDEISHTHVVVDGDTLSRLALSYLGDRERYLEIYEANRGVLSNPDMLPIGARLEIPPRRGTAAEPHVTGPEPENGDAGQTALEQPESGSLPTVRGSSRNVPLRPLPPRPVSRRPLVPVPTGVIEP